jgi:SAM-dependent methyltransferase
VGRYQERVAPRLVGFVCATRLLAPWRRRLCAGLSGTVLELGFGEGTNVPFFSDAVTTLYAVEPSRVARERARPSRPVVFLEWTDGRLPLDDASVDAVVIAFTLCTVDDPGAVLAEARRVLRPDGQLRLLEHGRGPTAAVQRWQHRLDPLERRLAGGCRLTRDPLALGVAAGFEVVDADQRYAALATPWTWITRATLRPLQPT